jgi:hypothetical protein
MYYKLYNDIWIEITWEIYESIRRHETAISRIEQVTLKRLTYSIFKLNLLSASYTGVPFLNKVLKMDAKYVVLVVPSDFGISYSMFTSGRLFTTKEEALQYFETIKKT